MPTIVALPIALPVAVPISVPSQAVPIATPQVTAAILAQGPQGPPGAAFSGFGYARYYELGGPNAVPVVLAPGVSTQMTMALDPSQTADALKGPFASQTFWDGSTLSLNTLNDVIQVRIAFTATTTVAGGTIKADLEYGAGGGALGTQVAPLPDQAGVTERVAMTFVLFGSPTLLAQGVNIFLTSTVPASLVQETVLVIPLSAGP